MPSSAVQCRSIVTLPCITAGLIHFQGEVRRLVRSQDFWKDHHICWITVGMLMFSRDVHLLTQICGVPLVQLIDEIYRNPQVRSCHRSRCLRALSLTCCRFNQKYEFERLLAVISITNFKLPARLVVKISCSTTALQHVHEIVGSASWNQVLFSKPFGLTYTKCSHLGLLFPSLNPLRRTYGTYCGRNVPGSKESAHLFSTSSRPYFIKLQSAPSLAVRTRSPSPTSRGAISMERFTRRLPALPASY